MKKIAFLAFAALMLTSCSSWGKLSATQYNNAIVENVNEVSVNIKTMQDLYSEKIPSVVNEKIEIDAKPLEEAYKKTEKSFGKIDEALALISKNSDQYYFVQKNLGGYKIKASAYLETYKAMLDYYSEDKYKGYLEQVSEIDENLHTAYSEFIDANNLLVDTLDGYVK